MKPSPEQVREWDIASIAYADETTDQYPCWEDARDMKFAELAAQWGAEQAQQAPVEEPELPEPVIAREEYAVGTGEFYTATQMHDHYAAGVLVGMAQQSQDAKRLDWLAIHGSFGLDSVTGKLGGNGQKRIAATRQAIDAAMQGGQK